MTPLEQMLRGWLDSPDATPDQKHHARVRLGLPLPPRETPPAIRTQHHENRVIRSCLYRDPHCGCDLPTCYAGYGDHDGGEKASREHCLACLRTTWGLI